MSKDLPDGVQVTMVRKGDQNVVPSADIVLAAGDALLIVADQQEAIAKAAARLGKLEPGRIVKDRSALDYIRVFVGKANVVGVPLAQLPMPAGFPAHLLHVRRYDMDIVPRPDLTLEFGDRVGVLMPADRKEEVRRHFGDTVKATAEFSYVSLGLGMVLGVLLGLIPIPIPGRRNRHARHRRRAADRRAHLRQAAPHRSAALGDAAAGQHRAAQLRPGVVPGGGRHQRRTAVRAHGRRRPGLTMLFIGVAVLLTTVLIVLLVGYYLMKIPYDDLLGVASGATGNPAILVYSTRMAPTERPDIGYAMIFPSATIVKVVAVQIIGIMVATGAG